MSNPPHILIATPAFGETVSLAYTRSLFGLQKHIRRNNVALDLTLGTLTSAFIDMARNYFATHMLENAAFTHLLFIDADHGYKPDLVLDMLALDKPVVGAVYAARDLDFDSLWTRARAIDSPDKLQSLATRYVLPPFVLDEQGKPERRGGFVRATMSGTGIMLIQRHVFERMAELPGLMGRGAEIMQRDGYSGRLLQCFRPIIQSDNLPLGEDLSFCRRWVQECDGEIWVSIDHEIQHVGPFTFKGRFADRLG